MPYHLWRIPPVLGVMACCALLLFAAAVLLRLIVRRLGSARATVAAAATFGLLAVLTRIPIRAMAAEIARHYDVDIAYVEPGRVWYLLPVLFAGFAFLVAKWVLRDVWISRGALLFYAWLAAFTWANVVNFCTPGYCGWIGLPLPWHTWSDNLATGPADGLFRFLGAVFVMFAAVVDLSTFVLVGCALVRVRVLRRQA